ncbi:hypothetical protein SAMN05216489_09735 [Streptomyces sp. 3213]|uniref:hypothetical protein n=1 Tax=Streptomyces sp. 3213.3 TaxID=1855348 RepID=UPI000895FD4D|nr:hypothetical protein [Streptomyces sp. 3213.3]SEF02759.1 hypothetical protein SAMN05216489_09735 [Streptomyces sp. 3213] [Streptomyces sp. 3213.3]
MLQRIRTVRCPALLAAGLVPVLAAVSVPAAADDSHEVALQLRAPSTFHTYNADEGAEATNDDFVMPAAVTPSDDGPARNVKVVVDTSGLAGVARAGKGGYGNCAGDGPVFTCEYGDVQNADGEANAPLVADRDDPVEFQHACRGIPGGKFDT